VSERPLALVIEDDEGASDLMKAVLEREGWAVEQVYDGKSGIDKAVELKPKLVVVDLMLPRMHGFEVCERLREMESRESLKILVASSKSYAQDIDGALEAGADAYFTKPVDIDALAAKVRELMSGNGHTPSGPKDSHPQS